MTMSGKRSLSRERAESSGSTRELLLTFKRAHGASFWNGMRRGVRTNVSCRPCATKVYSIDGAYAGETERWPLFGVP